MPDKCALLLKRKRERKKENRSRRQDKKRERKVQKRKSSSENHKQNTARPEVDKVIIDKVIINNHINPTHVHHYCNHIRQSKKPIELSFDKEDILITADSMVWLYAEVYQQIEKGNTVTCNYPENKRAEKVLQHIEFFKMIGKDVRIPPADITEKDIASWRVTKGTDFDGEEIVQFLENFIPYNQYPDQHKKIYIVMKELIANVSEHAYDKYHNDYKSWVMFGRLDIDDKGQHLSIIVCDLGLTIPVTMKKHITDPEKRKNYHKVWVERITRKLKNSSKLIKYATENRNSKTSDKHKGRGRGLHQVVKNAQSLEGHIRIYSGSGSFSHPAVNDRLQNKVNGTIITVRIPLNFKKF